MRKVFFILFTVLILQLTACQGSKPGPAPAAGSSVTSVAPYPASGTESSPAKTLPSQAPTGTAPSQSANSGESASSPSAVTTVPAPGKDTGVVTGIAFSTKMNAPLPQVGVYLGEYMYLTPGPHYLVTIREQGSPHTMSDDQGRFVIDQVPPGKYPLMLYTPFNSLVIPDAKGEKELVVEVKAGQVTDVGEIKAAFP